MATSPPIQACIHVSKSDEYKKKQRREIRKKAQDVNVGEMSNFWKIAIACVNPI